MGFHLELPVQATRPTLSDDTRNPWFDKITEILHRPNNRLRPKGNGFLIRNIDEDLLTLDELLDWVGNSQTLYGRWVDVEGYPAYYRVREDSVDKAIPALLRFPDVISVPAIPEIPARAEVVDENGVVVAPAVPAVPGADEVRRRPRFTELQSDFTWEGFVYGPLRVGGEAISGRGLVALNEMGGARVITERAYLNKREEYSAANPGPAPNPA